MFVGVLKLTMSMNRLNELQKHMFKLNMQEKRHKFTHVRTYVQ